MFLAKVISWTLNMSSAYRFEVWQTYNLHKLDLERDILILFREHRNLAQLLG